MVLPLGGAGPVVPIPFLSPSCAPSPFDLLLRGEFDLRPDPLRLNLRQYLPAASEEEIDLLRAQLAGSSLRDDGRPRYERRSGVGREAVATYNHAVKNLKKGANARGVLAAVASDLAGVALVPDDDAIRGPDGEPLDLSTGRMIGLADHRRGSGAGLYFVKPDKVYKRRSRGRRLLSTVGAWPWLLAADGRLPQAWREQAHYLAPLAEWLDACAVELREQLERLEPGSRIGTGLASPISPTDG